MSRGNKWVPLDQYLSQEFKAIKRPFSMIEAMFSYTVDHDRGKEGTISGYATLWQWSRNKVRRFISGIRTDEGHLKDGKRTHSGHPIHFIDKVLMVKKDSRRTAEGQRRDSIKDTTLHPNPNPNKKPPISPRGKIDKLKTYLQGNIPPDLKQFSPKIIEFYKYRQQKPKAKKYKTEVGINGLFRDLANCLSAGYNVNICIDIAMERDWLTPSVDYFKPELFSTAKKQTEQTGVVHNSPSIPALEMEMRRYQKYIKYETNDLKALARDGDAAAFKVLRERGAA